MPDHLTTIERAFALARSGKYATVTSIRKQLRVEGYQDKSQFQGPALYKQLRLLILAQATLDAVTVPSMTKLPSV